MKKEEEKKRLLRRLVPRNDIRVILFEKEEEKKFDKIKEICYKYLALFYR